MKLILNGVESLCICIICGLFWWRILTKCVRISHRVRLRKDLKTRFKFLNSTNAFTDLKSENKSVGLNWWSRRKMLKSKSFMEDWKSTFFTPLGGSIIALIFIPLQRQVKPDNSLRTSHITCVIEPKTRFFLKKTFNPKVKYTLKKESLLL